MSTVVPIRGEEDDGEQVTFGWTLPKTRETFDLEGKKLWTPITLVPELRVKGTFEGAVGRAVFDFLPKAAKGEPNGKWKILVDICELEEA